MSPIRFDILAKGRDLEATAFFHDRNRSMIEPGGDRLAPILLCQGQHPLWPGIGRNINVCNWFIQKRVAHAASDEQRVVAAPLQHMADILHERILDPRACDLHAASAAFCVASASANSIRAVAPQI